MTQCYARARAKIRFERWIISKLPFSVQVRLRIIMNDMNKARIKDLNEQNDF